MLVHYMSVGTTAMRISYNKMKMDLMDVAGISIASIARGIKTGGLVLEGLEAIAMKRSLQGCHRYLELVLELRSG